MKLLSHEVWFSMHYFSLQIWRVGVDIIYDKRYHWANPKGWEFRLCLE